MLSLPAPANASGLRRAAALAAALLAGGCITPVPEPVYSPCTIEGTSGWTARIEIFASAHPKPLYTRKLIVSGEVTVRDGYSVSLDRGPVARLDPPVQQIMIRTDGAPAAEGAPPVTRKVQGVFPALKRYGGIELRCGDGIVGEIREVTPAPERPR